MTLDKRRRGLRRLWTEPRQGQETVSLVESLRKCLGLTLVYDNPKRLKVAEFQWGWFMFRSWLAKTLYQVVVYGKDSARIVAKNLKPAAYV